MEIEYYTSPNGKCPIEKYLSRIPNQSHVVQILDDIELLRDFGLQSLKKSAEIEKIKGIKETVWELKTSCKGNAIYRTLFEFTQNKIHIVNIFRKREQKIKKQEINIALSRLKYNQNYET